MAYSYDKMRRIPVDPRVVEEISKSSGMLTEQGGHAGLMPSWGGSAQYEVFSQLPMEERLVYAAVLEGTTAPDQIEIVTGLDAKEVSEGLRGLQKRRLVSVEEVL